MAGPPEVLFSGGPAILSRDVSPDFMPREHHHYPDQKSISPTNRRRVNPE
jgi:hypothetical protein